MKWADAMAGNASDGAADYYTVPGNAGSSFPSLSWDPHHVWLTRIKQPRDHAIDRQTVTATSPIETQAQQHTAAHTL